VIAGELFGHKDLRLNFSKRAVKLYVCASASRGNLQRLIKALCAWKVWGVLAHFTQLSLQMLYGLWLLFWLGDDTRLRHRTLSKKHTRICP
jgi:hypothetical protein